MYKLNVGVLMGGKSIEKEVSFNSGRTVCDHLDTNRYTVIPLFQDADGSLYILPWHFLHRGKISDFKNRLHKEAQSVTWDGLKDLVDFVYITLHGHYAEDGTLQGMLDILNIPYLGSGIFASALGMDKRMQKDVLRAAGIDAPRGIVVQPYQVDDFETHLSQILEELSAQNISFPLLVKPYCEGSSLGISVVHTKEELLPAVYTACIANPAQTQDVLIEEKLTGMEFSCTTITDYQNNTLIPLPPTEIVCEAGSEFYDYEQKYMPGRATKCTPPRCKPELTKKIQETCMAAMKALQFTNLARIDGFLTPDERVVIMDANTLSGMAPNCFLFKEAAELNINHTQLINHFIETELHQDPHFAPFLHQQPQTTSREHPKMRVAVLLGGPSNERETSLESGRNVVYKLASHKYTVIPVFMAPDNKLYKIDNRILVKNNTAEILNAVTSADEVLWNDLPTIADFVFIGLHGGPGENGAVQGALEMLGLPYNGPGVLTSSLCMDKYQTNEFLRSKGICVPESFFLAADQWRTLEQREQVLEQILAKLPLPLIVKPHDDGCSVFVAKVENKNNLAHAIDIIFADNKTHALIEECIEGMELTVGVLGNEEIMVLPPTQTVKSAGVLSMTEKFLPGAGENQTPAPLGAAATALVQETMRQTFMAVQGSGYSRIDCFFQDAHISPTGKERVVVIEINTLPALTPATCLFHQAAEVGIRPMELIDKIVELGIERHKGRMLKPLTSYTVSQAKE